MTANELKSLLQGLQFRDPRLYDLLRGLIDQVGKLTDGLEPLIRQTTTNIGATTTLLPPAGVTWTHTDRNFTISWAAADGAALYEVRKGNVWETADFITRTPSLNVLLDPIIEGTHRYLVKSIDADFTYSLLNSFVDVLIVGVGQPSLTFRTIDNNVLLFWTEPSSTWEISYYNIKKDGNIIGTVDATFFSIFELQSDTFTYSVEAVDLAGNVGAEAAADIFVSSPPDYVLQSIFHSGLGGTRVNLVPIIEIT